MSIFDKIRSIEFDRNKIKIFGIKSAVVWGHSKEENAAFPLLYVTKPKHISIEEYEELLDSMDIQFIKK